MKKLARRRLVPISSARGPSSEPAHARNLGVVLAAVASSLSFAACSGVSSDAQSSSSAVVVSPDLVISQVFGGGGNSGGGGAPYTHDFVELFNRGQATVSLGGKSIQTASATGTFAAASSIPLPNVSLSPGRYFLVQLAGGSTGAPLPTADHVDPNSATLGNDKGKVALVDSTALLDGCGTTALPCTAGGWIDLVGYGTAQQFEGAAAGAPNNQNAVIRKGAGCQDTGSNANDFEVAAVAPRNTASAANTCDPDASVPLVDAGADADDASADVVAPVEAGDASSPADAGADVEPPDAAASTLVLLNEVKINPPGGTDSPWEYAEVECTPGASLAGIYFVAIEGDGDSAPGMADVVVDLGAHVCGTNGLAYVKASAGGHAAQDSASAVISTTALDTGTSPLENATTSFVLIRSMTPLAKGTDYDSDDDGNLDLPAGSVLLDGVSTFEQSDGSVDRTYAPRLVQSSGSADGASRIPGNLTPLSDGAWYSGDLSGTNPDGLEYDATKASANLPLGAVLTPGAANFVGTTVSDGGVASDGGAATNDASAPKDAGSSSGGKDAGSSSGGKDAGGDSGVATTPAEEEDDVPVTSSCTQAPRGSTPWMAAVWALALGFVLRRRR